MHIALLAPFSSGPTRGNIITVNRIAKHLALQDVQATLTALDQPNHQQIFDQFTQSPPDLLHAFHAYHSGPIARKLSQKLDRPYIITITGSDLFEPAFRDHPATARALQDAQAITCFDAMVAELLQQTFAGTAHKTTVIPQGVESLPVLQPVARPTDAFILLLPAALRPVKGILEAIDALTPLATKGSKLQLWLAGGDLDGTYATLVRRAAADKNWIKLYGEVPHEQMGAIYSASDVVLNSSYFEGGMANSLLEAMVCGKPVIAADVSGNRSLIKHAKTGFLYGDDCQLRELLTTLAQKPDQCLNIGRAAHDYVLQHFSPNRETTSLLQLYQNVIT